jgi:hypothetical protein
MGLNKKQKKQIDVLRKKQQKLQQLISAAKQQPDDPAELPRLQGEMAAFEAEIEKIKNS